jgi:hypothetical protein
MAWAKFVTTSSTQNHSHQSLLTPLHSFHARPSLCLSSSELCNKSRLFQITRLLLYAMFPFSYSIGCWSDRSMFDKTDLRFHFMISLICDAAVCRASQDTLYLFNRRLHSGLLIGNCTHLSFWAHKHCIDPWSSDAILEVVY